jgi:hypothetical protein
MAEIPNHIQVGDWISEKVPSRDNTLDLVYNVTQITFSTVKTVEYKRITDNGLIQATGRQEVTLATEGFNPIRVLTQMKHKATLKVAKEQHDISRLASLFWIFESGFIKGLNWDPGEWH